MNSKYSIFLCIYLFSFINVNAASFDCSKATTAQEKTICNTPSLSSLDEKLAKIYKEAMTNALDPQALKNEQRAWLKETRSCNAVPACLERSYETRISLLLPKKSDVQHQSQPELHKEKQVNAEMERLNAEQKKLADEKRAKLAAEQRAKQIAEENERRKKWEESPEGKKAIAEAEIKQKQQQEERSRFEKCWAYEFIAGDIASAQGRRDASIKHYNAKNAFQKLAKDNGNWDDSKFKAAFALMLKYANEGNTTEIKKVGNDCSKFIDNNREFRRIYQEYMSMVK